MTATIIVEDGSLISGANSYISVANFQTYASDRGITITGTEEDLLIQAMDVLNGYNYLGYRYTEDQALPWPRGGVVKHEIYYYDTNEIPQILIDAQCEIALAIDAGYNPLAVITRDKKKVKAGSVEVEYMDGTVSNPVSPKIMNKLSPLLAGGGSSGFFVVERY